MGIMALLQSMANANEDPFPVKILSMKPGSRSGLSATYRDTQREKDDSRSRGKLQGKQAQVCLPGG